MLTFVGSSGSSDSSLVFDCLFREMVEGDDSLYGAAQARRRVARMGEPFIFGIQRGRTGELVGDHGLWLEEDLGVEQLKQRYLTRAEGTLIAEPCAFLAIAHARVAPT